MFKLSGTPDKELLKTSAELISCKQQASKAGLQREMFYQRK